MKHAVCAPSRLALVLAAAGVAAAVVSPVGACRGPGLSPSPAGPWPSIADKTRGMTHYPGFLPLYWDEATGALWLEVSIWDTDLLHVATLPTGLGSNDIGIDRGMLGRTRLVRFVRSGNRVLLVAGNPEYRASASEPAERRSVREAFAESVLAGFEVAAETDGRVLVDAAPLLYGDAWGVAATLERGKQGSYKPALDRSAVYLPGCAAFPDNTELEAVLTFEGKPEGDHIRDVAPDARAVTLRQRHSFVRLPDSEFQPRAFDPRSGYFAAVTYRDYSAPIGEPLVRRLIARHRLIPRVGPMDESGLAEPVEPLVYYVDRGAPEPIRSALIEGALWWNRAFEAAGFKNALRVEVMPEDVDPMDARYNVIQWVHRRTRGWSYGSSVIDPRTGEIIKGHVQLGSLRVRQDYLIAAGLLAPYETGEPAPPALERLALARLRQLSAHEVGHTLGLSHNFAASADDRASVMDYPHPLVELIAPGDAGDAGGDDGPGRDDRLGGLDLANAYAVGVGAWDVQAIQYGYRPFPPNTSPEAQRATLDGMLASSRLRYVSDRDARPPGAAHPDAHLWDNGDDPVAELARVLAVRAHALGRFGVANVPVGRPLAELEEVLVPLYFGHRYQLEATSRLIGGARYSYAVRAPGDDNPGDGSDGEAGNRRVVIVPAASQRAALDALIAALSPEVLALPERVLALIPPRPPGYDRGAETFPARTGPTLDPIAIAESAADLTLALLLDPERAARLVEQHVRHPDTPGLAEVVDRLVAATWKSPPAAARANGSGDALAADYRDELWRAVARRVVYRLFALAANRAASGQVRAVAHAALEDLAAWLARAAPAGRRPAPADAADHAHRRFHLAEIQRFLRDPDRVRPPDTPPAPAGSPIGECAAPLLAPPASPPGSWALPW